MTELIGTGPWTTTVDVSNRPSGSQAFDVVLTYRSGGQARFEKFLVVDNDKPVIHDDEKQLDRTLLNQDVTYTPTITDTSDLVRLDLLIDGKVVDTSRPAAFYYVSWNVYGRRNGSYRLTLRATDPFGQSSEISRTVVVDTTPPTVVGLTPAHKAHVRGTFSVAASRVSDTYGVSSVELYVDGRLWGRDTRAPYGFTVKTRNASWYQWNALDKAGNMTSIERHIVVDTQAPRISHIKAPGNKARVRGKVTVTLYADDDFGLVRRVELLVNGKVVAKASAFPYRMTVDTGKQKKTMRVQIRAYDQAGNAQTTPTRTWYRR
jgi:hypothetical protein